MTESVRPAAPAPGPPRFAPRAVTATPPHPFDPDATLGYLLTPEAEARALARLAPRTAAALDRPVFVVGSPRSGTTVLGTCLSVHPALAGGEESLFLVDLYRLVADLGLGANRRGWAPLAGYLEPGDLLESCGRLADAVFGSLVRRKDAARYIDHTPWYAGLLPFVFRLYPDARVVHIVRDGRQVVRSLGQSYARGFSWAGATIAERARLWATLVDRARAAGAGLPREQYLEIRYEELCRAPRATLDRVLGFAGLDWREQVLLPLAKPHAGPSRPDAALSLTRAPDGRITVASREVDTGWPAAWSQADRIEFLHGVGSTRSIAERGAPRRARGKARRWKTS